MGDNTFTGMVRLSNSKIGQQVLNVQVELSVFERCALGRRMQVRHELPSQSVVFALANHKREPPFAMREA